jgi:hypothetical protein
LAATGKRMIAVGRADEALGDAGFQALLLHQPDDTLPAHAFVVVLAEIPVNPRAPVTLLARRKRRAYEHL